MGEFGSRGVQATGGVTEGFGDKVREESREGGGGVWGLIWGPEWEGSGESRDVEGVGEGSGHVGTDPGKGGGALSPWEPEPGSWGQRSKATTGHAHPRPHHVTPPSAT